MMDVINLHREMRQKRETVIRKSPIAMIDIGSSKIAVMIAHFLPCDNDSGVPSFRISAAIEARSNGVLYGEIVNFHQVESDLIRLLDQAQKMARLRVDYAMVVFSGGVPASFGLTGEVKVLGGEVGNVDISAAMSNCDFPDLGDQREYLHALPVNFSLDYRSGLHDPRGQVGSQLAVDMHALTIERSSVQNIRQLIKRVDMELIGVSTSAYMSGLAVLTEDEQKHGSAVVDIGSSTTSIAIFLQKQLLYTRVLNIGGAHVTSDIAKGLDISYNEAERLKTLHGGVEATSADDRDYLALETSQFDDRNYISRGELIGIIRPRMEEIFEEAALALEEAGIEHLPSQRIVLTGGASQLSGVEWLAEHYFGRRMRMGRVIHLLGAPTHQSHPNFAAVTGLTIHAAAPHDELWDFDTNFYGRPAMSWRGMFSWFRENW